jgi:hypothetical protein
MGALALSAWLAVLSKERLSSRAVERARARRWCMVPVIMMFIVSG